LVPLNRLGISATETQVGTEQRAEAFSSYQAALMIGGTIGTVMNSVFASPISARQLPYLSAALFLILAIETRIGRRFTKSLLPVDEVLF
jgi:predicted MFS family arabinose efflux permease